MVKIAMMHSSKKCELHKLERKYKKSRLAKKESESVRRSEFSVQEFFRCRQVAQAGEQRKQVKTDY